MTYSDYTDHPHIFRKVYWGRFKGRPEQSILDNRNKLAEFFSLRTVNRVPAYVNRILDRSKSSFALDHTEVYATKHSYIVFVSPYNNVNGSFKTWMECLPIYDSEAFTFLKVIPKRKRRSKLYDWLIQQSISKDVLYSKSLLLNNEDVELDPNEMLLVLFNGTYTHEETLIDFLTNSDETYKFVDLKSHHPSNSLESLCTCIHLYNTYYNKHVNIKSILGVENHE